MAMDPRERAEKRSRADDEPPALNALLALPPEEVGRFDIAALNLTCAVGLPGAEGLDVRRQLATLDTWTAEVERVTSRGARHFRNNLTEFENSEAYWRMLTLTSVLQVRYRVRYHPDRIDEMDWRDSRDVLLHGLLGESRTGTCPSLPVLIVAVGRRLGYPLRLALAVAHVFSRWDAPSGGERLNIECHGNGIVAHPDEYYHEWPVRWDPATRAAEAIRGPNRIYLRSLNPAEELAFFLCQRAHCLEVAGRWDEAITVYQSAARLWPHHPAYPKYVRDLEIRKIEAVRQAYLMARSSIGRTISRTDWPAWLASMRPRETHP